MERLWASGPLFDGAGGFPLGTDSVLLADFVNLRPNERGCELCCGSAALSLLLLWREPTLYMDGVELLPDAADAARRNIEANALTGRCRVITGDIRRHRSLLAGAAYDLVVCNPPYFASGRVSPNAARAAARSEDSCSLEDVLAAAGYLLRHGGRLDIVHRAERLVDIMYSIRRADIEPKRLRLVQHSAEHSPSLVLIEGRRGGKPGLQVLPALVLCKPNGEMSAEARRIYHMEDGA